MRPSCANPLAGSGSRGAYIAPRRPRTRFVSLSEEVAAATDESKDPYSYPEHWLSIGMLRLAFADSGERSLSMTPPKDSE
jgi:hypothetical protein